MGRDGLGGIVVCKECYSHYIQSKVVDEGESRRIQCMGKNCNVIVDEKTVELLVNPEILTRYVLPLSPLLIASPN